jgi:hypothetical protein
LGSSKTENLKSEKKNLKNKIVIKTFLFFDYFFFGFEKFSQYQVPVVGNDQAAGFIRPVNA